jgi:hypothetical protein
MAWGDETNSMDVFRAEGYSYEVGGKYRIALFILILVVVLYDSYSYSPSNYVWLSPLGAEQPWQGDSFSGCGIFR